MAQGGTRLSIVTLMEQCGPLFRFHQFGLAVTEALARCGGATDRYRAVASAVKNIQHQRRSARDCIGERRLRPWA